MAAALTAHQILPRRERPALHLVGASHTPVVGCAVQPTKAVHRRRQLVAVVVVVALIWLVVTAASVAWSMTNPVGSVGANVPAHHVVQPGETVWSIARTYQPSGDVRAFVDHIVVLNGSADLRPGQSLVLAR